MRYVAMSLVLVAIIHLMGCSRPTDAPAGPASEQPPAPSSDSDTASPPGATTAQPSAPVAQVRVVDENQFQAVLDELKGKVVLIDFWGTWCAPCLELLPHTLEAADKYGPQGLVVVAVAIDDPDDVNGVEEKLAQRGGYVIPLLSKYGVSSESVEKFGISDGALPHLKLLDRSGKIVETFGVGGSRPDPENIDAAIERTLASSPATS
ncbi:TlpA family protein disulfide reductase [Thermopirellula anaerolimosa]